MDAELRELLVEYLRRHNTLTLATCGPDGPAAAGLFYVSDERLRLYFLSEVTARHVQNLREERRVAAAIHEDYHDWRLIQGVQLRGAARPLDSAAEQAQALRLYTRKYPFVREFMASPRLAGELLARKLGASRFHVIEPHWMRWIDNRAGFGQRREYDLLADVELAR